MGYFISIANNKGGIGKTTASVTLSHALSARKYQKKVLLVDLDSQCNATETLIDPESFEKSLYDLLEGDASINECIYPSKFPNLDILPNIEDTAGIEMELITQKKFKAIKELLRPKKEDYDFIIADCPPNLLYFVYSALIASDFVIIPILASSSKSVKGLKTMIQVIDKVRESFNPDLHFLRLLINNVDKRAVTPQIIIKLINQTFSETQIFKTIIPTSTQFNHAEITNNTVINYAGGSPGAKAYRALAGELLEILETKTR